MFSISFLSIYVLTQRKPEKLYLGPVYMDTDISAKRDNSVLETPYYNCLSPPVKLVVIRGLPI